MAGGAVSVQKPYACHEGGFGWVGSCGKGSVSQKGKPQISEPPRSEAGSLEGNRILSKF